MLHHCDDIFSMLFILKEFLCTCGALEPVKLVKEVFGNLNPLLKTSKGLILAMKARNEAMHGDVYHASLEK